jgi:hypothetical protein
VWATSLAKRPRNSMLGMASLERVEEPDWSSSQRQDRDEAAVIDRLRRLTQLYRFGALTDAEFLAEKTKLLGSEH